MYQGKRKNKRWTIQEKNEIVLLYLDQHMGWNEILRTFNIPGDGMLQRWIEQYRKFGTCVDNVPIESFFSILKSECIYLKQNLQKEEIEEVVKNFIRWGSVVRVHSSQPVVILAYKEIYVLYAFLFYIWVCVKILVKFWI